MDLVHSNAAPRASVVALGVGAALLSGAGIATQARINGQFGAELGDGYTAALISFSTGLVIITIVAAIMPSARRGLRLVSAQVASGQLSPWFLLGGLAGGLFVLSQGLTAAVLGLALFTVAIVCGQAISGLVIDKRGLGTARPRPITVTRIIGSLLMLAAVVLVSSTRFADDVPLWAFLMPFAAGLAMGWQQAVNGQVRVASASPVTATFINFVAGTSVLAIAAVIHGVAVGWPTAYPANPVLYVGGLVGVGFIGLGTIAVPMIGVLLYGLGTIAGQLIVALLLDILLPVADVPVAASTVIGTALTLVAVALAALPRGGFRGWRGAARG